MEIIKGIIPSAVKAVVYGPEGIGKSTFASKFPDALFIDTEGSTKFLDVSRTQKPSSWNMLLEQVKSVKVRPDICKTLVIDTADWAEQLCMSELCAKSQKKGIEDFGYGKGYVYLCEEFGKFLNLLSDLIELGINVVILAHAVMRKFEQPDESGAYDRWELKLQKKTAPLLKEWADMVLFANYKTYVVKDDDKKAKAKGGKRVMYTTHHPCWDAKNRYDLPDEMDFNFSEIEWITTIKNNVSVCKEKAKETPIKQNEIKSSETAPSSFHEEKEEKQEAKKEVKKEATSDDQDRVSDRYPEYLKPLFDLMKANKVSERDIQAVVAAKGYYPANTPIENYEKPFIDGVLVGAWSQVFEAIKESKKSYKEEEF